jgi:nucleotide-binding universal stress UspA family protein
MFKKILIATDLANKSATALQMALALAASSGASVLVVHAVGLPAELRRWAAPVFRSDLKLYGELLDRQIDAARAALEKELGPARKRKSDIRCVVKGGTPAEVVADVADETGADLIVVGRGRHGLLGSTAERIVRMAGRTVLVAPVRPPPGLRVAARLLLPKRRARRTASAVG